MDTIVEKVLPVQHARDITTVFHVQKRIGKEFNEECSERMFKAIVQGEYSTTCNLSQADLDILKNLQYGVKTLLASNKYEVSWKPTEYHK